MQVFNASFWVYAVQSARRALQASKLVNFGSSVAHCLRWLGHSSLGQTVSQSSNFSFKADASGAA
jgi:hypothetical protein